MLHALAAPGSSCRVEHKYVRAEIYYYGWDILTRSQLSLAMIRENPVIHISIRDRLEVDCFVQWLGLDQLEGQGSTAPKDSEDPRLVIDLFRPDETRTTYFASRFNLVSEKSGKKRPIDESFRQKFTFR